MDYQASSPDEKALVEACANLGMVYLGDDDEILRIRIVPPHVDYKRPFTSFKPKEETFQRLHVLEFTSDRKRMSVIVMDGDGKKWIYTKGAESYVFPLCANSSAARIAKTDSHISDFARLGLRTLAIARRLVTEEQYQDFLVELTQANSSLENRKQLSEDCYAKIECSKSYISMIYFIYTFWVLTLFIYSFLQIWTFWVRRQWKTPCRMTWPIL